MATCPYYACKIQRSSSKIAAGCIGCDIDNLAGEYLPLCVRCNTFTKTWKCAPCLTDCSGCGRGTGSARCCCYNLKYIVASCILRQLKANQREVFISSTSLFGITEETVVQSHLFSANLRHV